MTMPNTASLTVAVDFDWRFAECARATTQVDRYRPRTTGQRLVRTAFTTLILGAILLTILDAMTAEYKLVRLIEIAPYCLLMGLWPALQLGGNGLLAAWLVRQNNPNLLAGIRHVISPTGYQVRSGHAESQVGWPGIVRVVETRAFFLTFPTRSAAYYLPKRVLDAEQAGQVRSLVQQMAGDRFVQLAA